MLIAVLFVVAFVVWHFIPIADPDCPSPSPKVRIERRAVATDPCWISFIEEHCESPAELAFLHAMVNAYGLKPFNGALLGAGIRLDFQVVEGRYRVDFLANMWLVVEIDGAAYHSSPEAIARDKVRDEYFETLGYSVLRIPAKVVFNTPVDAVRQVRSALSVGKRPTPVQVQQSGWQRLSNTMSAISTSISDINASVARARTVELALSEAKSAFDSEKIMIECAVERAKMEVKLADWLREGDESRKSRFENSLAELERAFERADAQTSWSVEKMVVRSFPASPLPVPNAEHNVAIQSAYSQIVEQRVAFLNAQQSIMKCDPRLFPLVEKQLDDFGCSEYCAALTVPDGVIKLKRNTSAHLR